MIDVGHLVGPRELWVPGFASNNTSEWRTLPIPRGAQMLSFFLVGAGGGGARPNAGAATAGGGGGGSGAVMNITIPASVLPKSLFISVAAGGVGATSNNSNGGSPANTWLSCFSPTTDEDAICLAQSGTGGLAAGTGGNAGAISSIATIDMASLGNWFSIAGIAGSNGNTGAGSSQLIAVSMFNSGGAGGAGSNGGTGGSQTSASAIYPTISGGATGGGNGVSGYLVNRPLICVGGTGGGGNNAGGGGNGGDGGGYGSGGAGGGNGTTTSGNGGNGAPGLLIMRWW